MWIWELGRGEKIGERIIERVGQASWSNFQGAFEELSCLFLDCIPFYLLKTAAKTLNNFLVCLFIETMEMGWIYVSVSAKMWIIRNSSKCRAGNDLAVSGHHGWRWLWECKLFQKFSAPVLAAKLWALRQKKKKNPEVDAHILGLPNTGTHHWRVITIYASRFCTKLFGVPKDRMTNWIEQKGICPE